jgi:hypothetical protein
MTYASTPNQAARPYLTFAQQAVVGTPHQRPEHATGSGARSVVYLRRVPDTAGPIFLRPITGPGLLEFAGPGLRAEPQRRATP